MRQLTAVPASDLNATVTQGDAGAIPEMLELPLAMRERSRFCALLTTGEEVAVVLERGTLLRGGALLADANGRRVVVVAAKESLLRVTADDACGLIRAAYHLGNRHVRLQVAVDCLHIEPDPVLADMLMQLGFGVTNVHAPFEPEGGIYGYAQMPGHHHGHGHGHGHAS